jgi:hypothetical protein
MSANDSKHARWARFRFSVIGSLLAAPPARGELAAELNRLSQQAWRHPITGVLVHFGRSTIERWLYQARETEDPLARLRRRVRKDAGGHPSLSARLRQVLVVQYRAHPSWSVKLHTDNLIALAKHEPLLGPPFLRSTASAATSRPRDSIGLVADEAPAHRGAEIRWSRVKCAATKPSTSMASGTLTCITGRTRC